MKKNVILVVIDTLRAKSLGAYGKKPSYSPVLDSLVKKGVIFKNAYTTTVWTDPVTTSIMTGLYPISNGLVNHEAKITDLELNNISKQKMLAEILKEHGYYTAAIDWLSRWFQRGFDYYSGWLVTENKSDRKTFGEETYQKFMRFFDLVSLRIMKRDFLNRIYYSFNSPPYDPADVVMEDAIRILKKKQGEQFFLYIHFWDPHYPYVNPRGVGHVITDSLEKRYLSEIESVDTQIKKLTDFLKQSELEENTLLIITGDHGESLTEHGIYIAHRGLYENTVKIPLILCHPSLGRKTIQGIVQLIDIVPTILDFINIKHDNKSFDGKSLLPLISDKTKKIRDFAFFEDLTTGELKIRKNVRRRGIRRGRYKYIQNLYGSPEFLFSIHPKVEELTMKEELYDLKKDPDEKNNLVNEQGKIKEEIRNCMDKFLKELLNKSIKDNQRQSQKATQNGLKKKSYDDQQVMKKFREMGYW